MRRAALALFAVVVAPVTFNGVPLVGASVAEAATVSQIVVRGTQRIDATTVRSYLTIEVGVPFTQDDINTSTKILFQTGLFRDVDIGQQGSSLVVTVVESPVVHSVTFEGNRKIKTDQLRSVVETEARGVLIDVKLQGDVERIVAYYQRSGRAGATVTPEVINLSDNRVDVVFHINEGDRTGIAQIDFVGNEAYSDRRLKSVIQTRTTNWLSWLTKRDVYDESRLQADAEMLRRFYLRNGYADFQVVATDAQFDEAKGRYYITITVEEGRKYTFGNIVIDSAIPGIDTDELMRHVSTKSGTTFDASKIERSLEEVTISLAERGFAFAQVRPRGDRNYATNTIDLTYMIDEGPRVYVERIDIHGNRRTRDYVIRREFNFAEGDPYNRVMVDKVQRRLRSLGFFKSAEIRPVQGSAPDRVVLDVVVEEDSTGEFSVSGGYSTSDGFIAELSLQERNFLGRGQFLKVTVGVGEDNKTYELSFTEPYFMGRRMPVGFDLYRRDRENTTSHPYTEEETGGALRVGLPINDQIDLQLNYKLRHEVVIDPDVGAELLFPEGTTVTSSVGYALTYSTIDNRQDPHNGLFFRLSQDVAGIGGDTHFIRSTFDARYYREILPDSDIVGFLKIGGGNITGLGENVRFTDNFFRGGETVRGFTSKGIGPRAIARSGANLGDDPIGMNTALGGTNYIAATAEVQFPFPILPDDVGLKGAVFADAGTLFDLDVPDGLVTGTPTGGAGQIQYVDDDTIRSSIGGSILWNSPFGLLRADFAHVLTSGSHDKEQMFRFSAGTQF